VLALAQRGISPAATMALGEAEAAALVEIITEPADGSTKRFVSRRKPKAKK
jgi:hypothetical protein